MVNFVEFFHSMQGDVCIDLCRAEIAVTQQFLDRANIRSRLEQVCCKRVSKRMTFRRPEPPA